MIDVAYVASTTFGVTTFALLLMPICYAVRLPAWSAGLAALVALGGFNMFQPVTVFEVGLDPSTGWPGYTRVEGPYFLFGGIVAALICTVVSSFAFRHAIPWQITAVLLSTLCLVFAAPNYPLLALLAGVAIGLFRIHSLRFSIALFSAAGIWLLVGVIAIHPALWADTALGVLVRQNWNLVAAPVICVVGLQFGASLHRRMLEARLGRERALATRELSALYDRVWPAGGAFA